MNPYRRSAELKDWQARQGHLLLQAGMMLFLLALLTGLLVHKFTVPRLGLSAHLLGLMQGLFLLVLGLLWPRLLLNRVLSRLALVLVLYGCLAAWLANLLGAVWGAGGSMLSFAAAEFRGNIVQETLITVALRTAAAGLLAGALLILWGLRAFVPAPSDKP